MASKKFEVNKSRVSATALADFLRSPVSADLTSVPGIGPANASKLTAVGISNTHQLLGKFLMLKASDMSSKDHCDAMWDFLADSGVSAYRSGIVLSIAEKVNTFIPGIYEEDEEE